MSEIYDAAYSAVRSKISNGDIGYAVESVIRSEVVHYFEMAARRLTEAFSEYDRPFVLLKPKLFKDGDQWCALYGDNLQDGLCSFGKTPSEAASNFDNAWFGKESK